MRRETVVAVLQLLGSLRGSVDEARKIIDDDALQVSDRNMIDHALETVAGEIEVLSRTFGDMLADDSKIEP